MTRNRATHGAVAEAAGAGAGLGTEMIALDPALAHFAPHLLGVTGDVVPLPMVDPTLFEIEQVVMDVRRGRIKLEPEPESTEAETYSGADVADLAAGVQGDMVDALGGEIDPAFRDIVNSLTRVQDQHQQQQQQQQQQQRQHAEQQTDIGPSQAAALTALSEEERDKLHISLQSTLDDLAQGNYGALLQNLQDHDPSAPYLLSDPSAAGPSSLHHHEHDPHSLPDDDHDPDAHTGGKRGRGRPKGSKNKPRPYAPPPPPKAPPPPPKPRGRPPKVRTPEEQAKLDRIMQERAMGIKRPKGRPRKFPGYLVREMRLKQNRQEFNELLRRYEDQQMHDVGLAHEHDVAQVQQAAEHVDGADEQQQHGAGDDVEVDYSQWDIGNGQTLLDVVGLPGVHDQPGGGEHAHGLRMVGDGDEPSADVRLGQGEMRVFDLPQ